MTKLENYSFKESAFFCDDLWSKNKIYSWIEDEDDCEESFVIDTPPPTVSGQLHMGHIFSYCQTDFIARYKRMRGYKVCYPIGFDDNGLPTERLVEKTKKITPYKMSRSDFISNCKEVSVQSRLEFKALFQSVGISFDWDLEYHTIDKNCVALSQMSFIDLYNKGLIYRRMQPMLWDPVDQTAIAQAEVEDKEVESFMNTIVFQTEDGLDLKIATTRPEMLAACVAVFYHPEDSRFLSLEGKFAITPIFNVKVPILADNKVKIDKGTGLVMCCTFGDELDIHWWKQHSLPSKIILNKYGKICNSSVEELNNLSVRNARAKILEMLSDLGRLDKKEEIVHSVKCAERSGSPLELLPTEQWFIKILDHKEEIQQRADQINWYPSFMKKRINIWIDGLNWDWCISRQRYFGVPFPIWYSRRSGEEGKILVADTSKLPVDPTVDLPDGYSKEEVLPDYDVMDTWATSSLTPQFINMKINKDLRLENYRTNINLPADLRPQSHEIIRTWAFYTILKANYHSATIPWKNIMISGWCLAEDKTKMSKSKGNVVTPKSIIELYGADVVRYWSANSRLGTDTAFSPDLFKIGQKLLNKIWNASKFVAGFLSNELVSETIEPTETIDLWILSKLKCTVEYATEKLEVFEYCEALEIIERFFWNDLCDNYFELIKKRAYANEVDDANQASIGRLSAVRTLHKTLSATLCLFAPFLPYITEFIYKNLFSSDETKSVHQRFMWPKSDDIIYSEEALNMGDECIKILEQVRKIKSEKQISIRAPITKVISNIALNESLKNDLVSACNANSFEYSKDSYCVKIAMINI